MSPLSEYSIYRLTDLVKSITALVRPQSIKKTDVVDIRNRGVRTVAVDLGGSQNDLVQALQGAHILIVCLPPGDTSQQLKLIDAASKAGVKRFVPNAWAVIAPPNDIMIRDWVRLPKPC